MPRLLAFDCATDACSVALLDGDACYERHELSPQQHSQLLLPMVESLLAASQLSLRQLDAIVFGRGPGSFTGLRIAVGMAQGLAFGADLPVVGVSSLAALARTWIELAQPRENTQIIAAFDARMGEVYWGVYQAVANEPRVAVLIDDRLSPPERVVCADTAAAEFVGVGSGWRQDYLARMPTPRQRVADLLPRAGALARLGAAAFIAGAAVAADRALPLYLRDNVAETKSSREQGADVDLRRPSGS